MKRRPRCAIIGVLIGVVAGCAVGPNFKPPEAPAGGAFVPAGKLPAVTASAPLPGGEAQRFVDGLDIPGQWWTLFRSEQLNELIGRALAHSPTLEAAQAALRQANETAAAQHGALYPSASGTYEAQRAKSSAASIGLPSSATFYYTLNSASVNVSYTLDAFGGIRRQIEALNAQAEYERFALEASYLSLTANVVTAAITEASLRAQVAATEEIARLAAAAARYHAAACHGRRRFARRRAAAASHPASDARKLADPAQSARTGTQSARHLPGFTALRL